MKDQHIIEYIRARRYSQAFNELYEGFAPVKKLILQRGGSEDDAKDIYQEALIVLCKKAKAENFTLTSSLSTWLFSVCRFMWNDELKRRKKLLTADPDKIPEMDENTEELIRKENAFRMGEEAFRMLNEKCRQILRFFYFENYSMKTIASKLGYSSEKIAKNQKYKCLETARGYLDKIKNINSGLQTGETK